MDKWEPSGGIVVVILLAEVRETEAHGVCAFLPGHVVG